MIASNANLYETRLFSRFNRDIAESYLCLECFWCICRIYSNAVSARRAFFMNIYH